MMHSKIVLDEIHVGENTVLCNRTNPLPRRKDHSGVVQSNYDNQIGQTEKLILRRERLQRKHQQKSGCKEDGDRQSRSNNHR